MPTGALADKLARYTRLYYYAVPDEHGEPTVVWRTRYPAFPILLLVFDGPRSIHKRPGSAPTPPARHRAKGPRDAASP